jgi:hypothetical protein
MLALLLALGTVTGDCGRLHATCADPDSTRRAALHAALEAFTLAFRHADAEALDTLLTADYLHTNGGSGAVLDRSQWLDYVRSRRGDLQRGKLRVDRHQTSAVTIRWYPSAAVVSSQVTSEGIQSGVPFTSRVRVTQVWIQTGERWRRAAFHDSPIPRGGP